MPTIISTPHPLTLITSWPELSLSKWYSFNPPVFPDQQYFSDTHLQTDWYPSDCCHLDHLSLYTIQQSSSILCSTISILLATADTNWELLHIEVMRAGWWFTISIHTEYSDGYLHCINIFLQLWQYSRVGGDNVVEGLVPGSYWCGNSTGI
jgi:hypothetical protein